MRILTNDTDFYSGLDAMVYNNGYEECAPGHSFGPAYRRSYMIHYVTCGKGIFRSRGKEWSLKAGDAFFIAPGEEVYYEADKEDPWGYGWIGLQGMKIHEYLTRTSLFENPVFHYDRDDRLTMIFIRVARAYEADENLKDLLLNEQLYALLRFLTWEFPASGPKNQNGEEQLLKDVMSHCLMHLDEPLCVEEIASAFHMDRSVLSRRFHSRMKMTLRDYIWKIKEEEACHLLKTTDSPIDVIARSVGYEDASYFGRIFRQKTGMTPGKWRKIHQ